MAPSFISALATLLFVLALVHTFSTSFFEGMALRHPRHKGLFHLLGEVEVVFGFWAMVLFFCMMAVSGVDAAIQHLEALNFTEPLFVFVVMVVAATRPVLSAVSRWLDVAAGLLPLPSALALYVTVMVMVPLLGSFITEPAAMTLAALILSDRLFSKGCSTRLRYVALGVLFVNVSIGGTLTAFAAPPVLMIAGKWGWDSSFMAAHMGWKAVVAVCINALWSASCFYSELKSLSPGRATESAVADRLGSAIPRTLTLAHFMFLAAVVMFSHHPIVFMGLFLFFLGVTHAYERHQDRLILREGLLVAFFLAGLVVLGSLQAWWLSPLLLSMSDAQVFWGATALTALTDNAALTYLGSLVEGLSPEFKYALVTGAVTGGGLTVIANAPNPAGVALLKRHFPNEAVSPLSLFVAASLPTGVAAVCFLCL